ncbi:phosphoribosylanthranilate isomerase [Lacihabitans sp. LS3-19]|uniref:phosphoribosylanthranilate isomerase n=1 Tax=Lacihabitans sp. LS3-19 TaxID=2487335 RepID=UPI0020CB981A|nr:phosphoribosylanthranilate isomerase [Lacihabitans sp. LS3-19]MCP9769163.1 phosphoribosylanthranilate isomerase [Lacihabitans sp. LS3-19]
MLKIKVCGMRANQNILELAELRPDFMGLIFYEKSPRFVENGGDLEFIKNLNLKKVGVFVNADIEEIKQKIEEYKLDYVQLHGHESPDFCKQLQKLGVGIFKAFSVDSAFDFEKTEAFEKAVDYFLFDTKGDGYGGHGKSFDWTLLKKYNQKVPFLLAGGVSLDNLDAVLELKDLNLAGVDVNSKFETSPGLKDISALKILFEKIRKR